MARSARVEAEARVDPQVRTFLSLFFDLAYIYALLRLSATLLEHLTWLGALQTLILMLGMWWIWAFTAWATDKYDPKLPKVLALVIVTMFASLIMSTALPDAFTTHGLLFAIGYVSLQVGRTFYVLLALPGGGLRRHAARVLFWFAVSAVLWIAGGAVHGTSRTGLWALAVALDYGVARLNYPTPGLGRSIAADWSISADNLAERYRQILICSAGEIVLVSGQTLTRVGFGRTHIIGFVVAFAATVLLWRAYFHLAGHSLGKAVASAKNPGRIAAAVTYTHFLMVAGVIVTSVGAELVIANPVEHAPLSWTLVILGGPALFLAGRALFEKPVFGRVYWSRLIGAAVLVVSIPAMRGLPAFMIGIAADLGILGTLIAPWAIRVARVHRRATPSDQHPSGSAL
ncbi:low temperature requirement protein A [Micromonospora sp. IBHARD004]|uniref:low temperature requirement protein A n=1 Tax=Micromonospora sp. IBHARD004 TaxID=3457764 RepID=UPI00405833D4